MPGFARSWSGASSPDPVIRLRQPPFAVVIERRTRLRSEVTEPVDEAVAVQAWTEAEYEAIFRDHPPTQPTPPARSECESLAAQFGRSPEAISAHWDDGRSLVLGQKTAASARLADYLARRGWL